jgi:hypothetical protein
LEDAIALLLSLTNPLRSDSLIGKKINFANQQSAIVPAQFMPFKILFYRHVFLF